jgi:membrane-associated protease RseP (regulator of RpoE activity)
MKRLALVSGLLVTIAVAVGGGLAFSAFHGGSGDALAASTQDVFSSINSQNSGTTDSPYLGAQIRNTSNGPTVANVIAGSPAEKAGLQRGDVITAVDGTAVTDLKGVLEALKGKNVGDQVTFSITRDGNPQTITATLEARPEPLPGVNKLLPELNGIAGSDLFSHLQGGTFSFTDKDGKQHTLSVDLGTVSSVDVNGNKITVTLNAGGSKTYDVTANVATRPADLSKFSSGDKVVILSADGNVRAIAEGGLGILGKGLERRAFEFGMMGNWGDNENGGNSGNGSSLHMPYRGMGAMMDYR